MTASARRAGVADVAAVSALLADAFADYAWTRWTVQADGHPERVRQLQQLAVENLALPYGEVWVLDDDGGALSSAAVWMRPGLAVPDDVWTGMAERIAELEGDRHAASVVAETVVLRLKPSGPHYYLGAVGTAPRRQRQGLGSAVLAPVLERADIDGCDAYLETSDIGNVAFYKRLGFEVVHEVDIPGGGPHVWAMLRKPHRSR